MAYLGNTPTTQSFISGTDYFNGDGSTTAFTLSRTVNSVNDVEAVINNVVQQPNTAYNISGTTITFTSAPSAGTGNIYVRYLSTTTQSITPSQNTVSWNTLDTNTQNDLGISFKNRIINGAMVIDQRNAGASVTPTDLSYTVDRWYANLSQASKFSVQQNAGGVTPPAGFTNYLGCTSLSSYSVGATDYFAVAQAIEGFNIADLGWGTANAKTVTISFWVRSSITGTFGASLRNGAENYWYPFSYSINAGNTWEKKSITITAPTSGTWLTTNGTGTRLWFSLGTGSTYSGTSGVWTSSIAASVTGATSVVGTNGATFYITGVQFEVGTQATTFDYRDYGRELILCQRYYELLGGGGFTGRATGSTTAEGASQFCVTKRTTPTVTLLNGTSTLLELGVAVRSFTTYAITGSLNGAYVAISGSSGLTSPNMCVFYNSSSIVGVSAEL